MATAEGAPARAATIPVDEDTLDHDNAPVYHYQSYLVRLWRTGAGEWRGSLQSAQSGERHLFADLDALFAFLLGQLPA